MPGFLPHLEPSSDLLRPRLGKTRQPSRTSPPAITASTKPPPVPTLAPALEPQSEKASPPCSTRNRHSTLPRSLNLYHRRGRNGWRHRIHGIAQPLPLVVAAAQWAHALDAQFMQDHRGFGSGGLARASTVKYDVAVARNLEMAGGQGFRRKMKRAGKSARTQALPAPPQLRLLLRDRRRGVSILG